MCWIKGVLLELVVAGTIIGGVLGVWLVSYCLGKLGRLVDRAIPDGVMGKIGGILFIGIACAMVFGFTWMAKENVCQRGFVAGYKAIWSFK